MNRSWGIEVVAECWDLAGVQRDLKEMAAPLARSTEVGGGGK